MAITHIYRVKMHQNIFCRTRMPMTLGCDPGHITKMTAKPMLEKTSKNLFRNEKAILPLDLGILDLGM